MTGDGPVGQGDDLRVPAGARRRRSRTRDEVRRQAARGDRARSRCRSTWPTSWRSRAAAVSRSGPTCAHPARGRTRNASVESGTVVRYDSGAGAPWVDACQVPVRIAGQDRLDLPLGADPGARARSAAGASRRVDDRRAGRDRDVRPAQHDHVAAARRLGRHPVRRGLRGSAFQVSLDGSNVTVTGADRAVPGSEEAAIVSVTSHNGVAPVRLILRVGCSALDAPAGRVAHAACTEAAGSSCSISVIGAPGEVNPLPKTPLEVFEVRPAGDCQGVSFAVGVVVFGGRDVGGGRARCHLFRDLLGARRAGSTHERRARRDPPPRPAGLPAGARELWPRRPTPSGTLTLRVDPGDARLAYPALSGFVIRSNGVVVTQCSADGTCPVIAAPNGERRTYEAFAVNAVGQSHTSVRTDAWAYDPPPVPASVHALPVATAGDGGIVALSIDGIDPAETGSLEISSATGETVRVPVGRGQTSVDVPSYRVGTNTATPVTIRPLSRFDVPPGIGGGPTGGVATVSANGIGAPVDVQLTLTSASNGDGTSTVTAHAVAGSGGDGSTLRYGIVREGARCTASRGWRRRHVPRTARTARSTGSRPVRSPGSAAHRSGVRRRPRRCAAQQTGRAPTGWTFAVDGTPNVSSSRAEWVIRSDADLERGGAQPQPRRVHRLGARVHGLRPGSRHPGALCPPGMGDRHTVGRRHPPRR